MYALAQVAASGEAGGPYSAELQVHRRSDQPGQVQSRVDIAVVSSAFPIIDPGHVFPRRTGNPTDGGLGLGGNDQQSSEGGVTAATVQAAPAAAMAVAS